MKISKIIVELSKLDFKTSIFFSNNRHIWFGDLFYIRIGEGKVKSYTVLKLQSISYSNGITEYHLADEYEHTCSVERERIYLYKRQNLKIQRIYDIITQTISIVLITALFGLMNNLAEILKIFIG